MLMSGPKMDFSVGLNLLFSKVHSGPIFDKCSGLEIKTKSIGSGAISRAAKGSHVQKLVMKCFPLPNAHSQKFSLC
jgi:hypothetical protein